MFERFTAEAKPVVVSAQRDARELDQPSIGTSLLLLGVAEERETAGGRGVDRARGRRGRDPRRHPSAAGAERAFSDEDEDALRSVGIDLDEVRRSVEEAFGPGALDRGRARRAGTSRSRAARRRRSSSRCARRSPSATSTSGPSTSCSGSCATSGARRRGSWRRAGSTASASAPRCSARSRAAGTPPAAPPERPPAPGIVPLEGTPRREASSDRGGTDGRAHPEPRGGEPLGSSVLLAAFDDLMLSEYVLEPGTEPGDPHYHANHTDAFYVLEGELEFVLDGRAGPGDRRHARRRAARRGARVPRRDRRPRALPEHPHAGRLRAVHARARRDARRGEQPDAEFQKEHDQYLV